MSCSATMPPSTPLLLIFFGLTASGKSTLAKAFASRHGIACHNTDRVRKELVGLPPSTPRPDGIDQGIYTAELTAQTYATLCARGLSDLRAGQAFAVLDGSYSKRADRDSLRQAAQEAAVCCRFFFCACSVAETLRRLEQRKLDPMAVSDGRLEIFLYQQKKFVFPQADETDCFELNTEKSVPDLLCKLELLLKPIKK